MLLLTTVTLAQEKSQSASIFVQDPAVFRQQQAELEKLKQSVDGVNEGLESLPNYLNQR